MVLLKILLILCLLSIVYQDFKERYVYLWLLVLTGVLMAYFHFVNSTTATFLNSTILNLSTVLLIIFNLYLYSKFKLKKSLSEALGIGDILFFCVLAIGFSTVNFLVLFTFSSIFSLIIFITLKSKLKQQTVPLAGLQSLFFSFTYLINWVFPIANLYTI